MKAIILGLLALASLQLNAQKIMSPPEVVTELFVSVDQRDWARAQECFAQKTVLDYSSMNGAAAATLKPEEIIGSWKGILPGFASTHHQLGNFQVSINGSKAQVFCYGTASHYLEDEAGNLWTVVGTYDFELAKSKAKGWEIESMRFNLKYQDGNTALANKAMDRLKK